MVSTTAGRALGLLTAILLAVTPVAASACAALCADRHPSHVHSSTGDAGASGLASADAHHHSAAGAVVADDAVSEPGTGAAVSILGAPAAACDLISIAALTPRSSGTTAAPAHEQPATAAARSFRDAATRRCGGGSRRGPPVRVSSRQLDTVLRI